MAVRVTEAEVKGLFSTSISVSVLTSIETANRLVNGRLLTKGLSAGQLKDIELWLSAHLVAQVVEEGGLISRRVGNSSAAWSPLTAKGLGTTRFGNMAISLDTSGTLALLGKGKVSFRAL